MGYEKDATQPRLGFAVVLLNQPIDFCPIFFTSLWNFALMRVCAAGAANHLYQYEPKLDAFAWMQRPNMIVGDLRMVDPCVKEEFSHVATSHETARDTTDLQKAYAWIERKDPEMTMRHVVVLNGLTGGMDHMQAACHFAQAAATAPRPRRIYLLSPDNMAVVLLPGMHQITCNRKMEGPHCGLFPFGTDKAPCTTTGLERNLDPRRPLQAGAFVSSSNRLAATGDRCYPVVTVETSSPLLWTTQVQFRANGEAPYEILCT